MKKVIIILLLIVSIFIFLFKTNDYKYKYNDKYIDLEKKGNMFIFKDNKRNIELIDGYNKKYNEIELKVRSFNKNENVDELLNIFSILEDINDYYLNNFNYKRKEKLIIIVNLDFNNSKLFLNNYIVLGNKDYYKNPSVLMHEYTHLVISKYIKSDDEISNTFKEAYCDIMSFIYTNSFIIGDENHVIRNIENPHLSNNPISINDQYYKEGKYHNNSTIISHIAYNMYKNGIVDLKELGKIWFNSLNYLDEISYKKLYESITKELDENKKEEVKKLFIEANIKGL